MGGCSHSVKSKSLRHTSFPLCDSDWWVVVSHGSRVRRVTGQLTDGSRGSWVTEYDPLSAQLCSVVKPFFYRAMLYKARY